MFSWKTQVKLDGTILPFSLNLDYFEMSAPEQAEIINQLEAGKDLWGAIPFIINCLRKEGLNYTADLAPYSLTGVFKKTLIRRIRSREPIAHPRKLKLPAVFNFKGRQPQVSPTDGGFHDILGPGRLFLMLDEANQTEISVNNKQEGCPRLAAFVSLARNDEVDITVPGRETWSPWIGCVFTYPEYRGQRLSEKLISLAEEYAIKEFDAKYTYISTDHIGLYEKYGYEFLTEAGTVWGEQTRVLRKKLK